MQMLRNALIFFVFIFFYRESFSQTSVKSIHITDQSIIAGTNYGVFVFETELKIWRQINNGLPENAEINLLTEHRHFIFGVDQNKKLFAIQKKDTTWKKINLPVGISRINSMFSNDTALFLTDLNHGIIYSTDTGKTWKNSEIIRLLNKEYFLKKEENTLGSKKKDKNHSIANSEPTTKVIDFLMVGKNMLVAISSATPGQGIMKSGNLGKTWEEASFDLQRVNMKKIIAVENCIYALSAGLNGEIYFSVDEGLHWEKMSKPNLRWITLLCAENQDVFAAHSRDGIFVTYNKGLNWEQLNNLKLKPDQTIEFIHSKNQILYIGTSDGLICMELKNGVWVVQEEHLKTTNTGSFFYANIGEKNGVTLYAGKYTDEIIFKAENKNSKSVHVDIQLIFECEANGKKLPSQKIEWRITIPPDSSRSYDTEPKACSVISCGEKTIRWEITGWKVNQ